MLPLPQLPPQLTEELPGHWQDRVEVTVSPEKLGAESMTADRIPDVSVSLGGLLMAYCAPTRAALATAVAMLRARP